MACAPRIISYVKFAIMVCATIALIPDCLLAQLHGPSGGPNGAGDPLQYGYRESPIGALTTEPLSIEPQQQSPTAQFNQQLTPQGGHSFERAVSNNSGDRWLAGPAGYPIQQSGYNSSVPPQFAPTGGHPFDHLPNNSYHCESCGPGCVGCEAYTWTLLPAEVLYTSYLGAPREARLGQGLLYLKGTGWVWELEAGGRAGILRYGTTRERGNEGFQLDLWGSAFPRLNFEEALDVDAVDFKVGVPLTWTKGRWQAKVEWYHISSHLGDEFLLRNPTFPRIDYLRDSIVFGGGFFPTPDWRLYAEADWAYNTNGGAKPWHFQFGVDYAPNCITGFAHPTPFWAVSGLIREEANFSGGINIVAGWQWIGHEKTSRFRIGAQYYAGQSLQYSFINDYEELAGLGMWYDF